MTTPKRKYRVTLPIMLDGQLYEFGREVELDLEQAAQFSHALIAVEEETQNAFDT